MCGYAATARRPHATDLPKTLSAKTAAAEGHPECGLWRSRQRPRRCQKAAQRQDAHTRLHDADTRLRARTGVECGRLHGKLTAHWLPLSKPNMCRVRKAPR